MRLLEPPALSPAHAPVLQKLLESGYKFVTFEKFARYLAVEKQGFAALLEPAGNRLKVFGQAGFWIGEGLGMLVETAQGQAFVWHSERVPATPELLARYEQFRKELQAILEGQT